MTLASYRRSRVQQEDCEIEFTPGASDNVVLQSLATGTPRSQGGRPTGRLRSALGAPRTRTLAHRWRQRPAQLPDAVARLPGQRERQEGGGAMTMIGKVRRVSRS